MKLSGKRQKSQNWGTAKGFVRSRNLCRFLRFVVEQGLDGNREKLKEYWIGVHIFQRGESFDPSADPIVRVQARRLRKKLHEYYDGEGRGDRSFFLNGDSDTLTADEHR